LFRDRDRDVRVRLDAAGDDDLADGVDDAAGIARQGAGRAQRDDLLALHADIEPGDTVGHHNLSTLDHEVEHGSPPAATFAVAATAHTRPVLATAHTRPMPAAPRLSSASPVVTPAAR
jgi:hypothetical protein